MALVSEKGYSVIKSFEGRALKAYKCPAGVWTIGYGNTNHDKYAVEYIGRAIGPGVTITEAQAEHLLRQSVERQYAPPTAKAFKNRAPQHVLDAGTSFHYNTGAISRASWVSAWLASNVAGVRAGLMAWTKGGGRVLSGLVRRRQRELAMVERGDYGPEGRLPPPVLGSGGKVVGTTSPKDVDPQATPGLLRKGFRGPEVRDVEQDLFDVGMFVSQSPDEVFDSKTEEAVRAFQRSHGQLEPDGIVGPATRAALKRSADAARRLKGTAVGGAVVNGGQGAEQAMPVGGGEPLLPMWSLYLTLAITAMIAGYYVWSYRDEIAAYFRRLAK